MSSMPSKHCRAGGVTPPAPAPDGGGSSVGVAVGAAIGGIAAVAAAAGGFVWWRRHRRAQLAGAHGDPEKAHSGTGGGAGPAAIDSYLDPSHGSVLGPLGQSLAGGALAGRSGSLGLDAADKLVEKSFGSAGTPKSVNAGAGPSASRWVEE